MAISYLRRLFQSSSPRLCGGDPRFVESIGSLVSESAKIVNTLLQPSD